MPRSFAPLRARLREISRSWMSRGLPSRETVVRTAGELERWQEEAGIPGIWPTRPLMATATLDDGLGQGLEIIERYAGIAGLEVRRLGLLMQPYDIIDDCNTLQPALLGMTILQLDSDDDLARVGRRLPGQTRLIAGGPVFRFDPQMAQRCGVDHVAPDVACFVDYLLQWRVP